jgi:hypothetical protein
MAKRPVPISTGYSKFAPVQAVTTISRHVCFGSSLASFPSALSRAYDAERRDTISRSAVRFHVAQKKMVRKPARKAASKATRRRASAKLPAKRPTLPPVKGADLREVGRVRLEVGRAGEARVKRMVYPPGFRWSVDMKPIVGTDRCMHAHVGFLVSGEIHIEYADGCVVEHKAPQIIAIEPGHDGWVVGRQPVVLIEFDFERDTIRRLGMPEAHRH